MEVALIVFRLAMWVSEISIAQKTVVFASIPIRPPRTKLETVISTSGHLPNGRRQFQI
jgi:hypothetical protein